MNIKLFLFILLYTISISLTAQKKHNDTIPFKNDLGLIIIPIHFNGQKKNFVFDTGATHSIGYSWVKNELKKTKKTINVVSSSQSKFKLRYYKSDSINLASARITKHKILKARDSNIFSCYNIDGILGMDILSHFNWLINFKEKYVVMLPSDSIPKQISQKMYALDFVYENQKPMVFFNINDTPIKFLLDTGATSSDINVRYKKRIKDLGRYKKEIHSTFFDFNGIMNKTKSTVIKFSGISSGSFISKPILELGVESSKIGNSLWKDTTLFLSVKNNVLYSSVTDVDEFQESYGSSFVFENSKIIVAKVIEGSLAWQQGLRQGTEILKINEKEFNDFCSVYKFQNKMIEQKKDLDVTLKNGKTITLSRKSIF